MVAEHDNNNQKIIKSCSLAKISMVAERGKMNFTLGIGCSLAKISMVAELRRVFLQKE